jgi:MscS family membrane protein
MRAGNGVRFLLLPGLALLFLGGAPAGQDSANRPAPASDAASSLSGLATPRSAVQGYLIAARAARYAEAAHYLELSGIPERDRNTRGPLLARELKIVLDQKLWIDVESLSDLPEGNLDDGLRPDLERIGAIQSPRGVFGIALGRIPGPDGDLEWRFTPGTLERVEILYSEFGYGPLLSLLPDWATRMRVGNVQAWQWIALLLLLALGILASQTLTRAVYAAVHLFGRRTEPEFRKRLLESVRLPVRLATTLAVVTLGSLWLHLSVPARRNLGHVGIGLLLALIAYALMKLVDLAVSRTLERLQAQGRRSGVSTLVLLRRCLKGVIVAVAGLALLQNLGFNVTGLLTGFGIAGAAIALAAQKTLENLFAGLVLAADEPVRIGDLCRFGNQQGIVEDIGLRSTRIRTFDRSVIYVPNAEMSTIQIENLAVRDRMRLLTTLSLRYETTQEQLTAVLGGIRELLAKDERVAPEDLRVRFVAFGPYSLDVEVMAYVLTTDFATFLEIREDLYLRIMRIVRESGTGFAFPSQTLYVAPDPGRGAART